MTFKELLENEKFVNEIKEAAEKLSSENDEQLFDALLSAAEKYGVKATKEEILNAIVSKLPVSDEELDAVTGGAAMARKSLSSVFKKFLDPSLSLTGR